MASERIEERRLATSHDGSRSLAIVRAVDLSRECHLTRRGFCNGLVLASAALVVAENASASKAPGRGSAALPDPPIRIEGAEALMPGSSLLFSYPGVNDPAILVRARDGNFHAYCQKCSHLGCSVYFERNLDRLECPCHKGAYDVRSGFVLAGPPKRPLDEIILQLRGGQVWAVGRRSENEPLIAD